jgi:hypothetical protein
MGIVGVSARRCLGVPPAFFGFRFFPHHTSQNDALTGWRTRYTVRVARRIGFGVMARRARRTGCKKGGMISGEPLVQSALSIYRPNTAEH